MSGRSMGAWAAAAAVIAAAGGGMPMAAWAADMFVCQELKAAVDDAERGFAAHKGAVATQAKPSMGLGKTFLAKKTLSGAKSCSVVEVSLDEPKMRLRQTGYRCQFPAVFKLDKVLRTQLSRCIAGEVDDPSDPDDFTLWVERVSSGEGYRGTEVNAQANAVDGLTLSVRQSVCMNKGSALACED